MKKIFFIFLTVFSLSAFAQINIKDGETVAFLGDSITQLGGWQWPYIGYIHLVHDGLKTKGINIKFIRAGISGHHSTQMLKRQKKDVLDKKPQWMFLCTGANDMAFKIPMDTFRKNIDQMVKNAQNAGIKVVLMTSVPRENSVERNKKLKPYIDFVRTYAKENKICFVDVNKALEDEGKSAVFASMKGIKFSYDGVHLNGFGHIVMASAILKECGIPEKTLAELKKKWTDDKRHALELFVPLTHEEQFAIAKEAKKAKMKEDKFVLDYLRSRKAK